MKKVLYIGGVGGSAALAEEVAAALSDHFKANALGLSLHDALRRSAYVARLARDSIVITHSVGMMALKNTSPMELIAVAPPMPSFPLNLIGRSFPKNFNLLRSGSESSERSYKVWRLHGVAAREMILRPQSNLLNFVAVSRFDAAKEAVTLASCGTKVTLVLMENERLFPQYADHPHMEVAQQNGVRVVRDVLGHHDEFLLYPLDILAQIK